MTTVTFLDKCYRKEKKISDSFGFYCDIVAGISGSRVFLRVFLQNIEKRKKSLKKLLDCFDFF